MKIKLFSVFCIVIMLLTCLPAVLSTASEKTAESTVKEFLDNDGRIIGISSKGEWDNYPENSIPAIIAAKQTDIDMVLIDVRKTSDGILIVFSDETTERMLECDTVHIISETEYSVLSRYKLRNGCGGINSPSTEYTVPTLDEALTAAEENNIALMIRCDAALIPEISKLLQNKNMLEAAVIMTDADADEIEAALSECDKKPHTVGSVKGNVIFVINSFVNSIAKTGCTGVELKTGNRYGINYYPSLLSKYSEKMRVIANPTIPEECGAREDCESWWNDLISRGYSVIITDHAEMFTEYLSRTDAAKKQLRELYDKYVTNHTLPDFKDENLNDMKKAYTDAVSMAEALLEDNSSAVNEINECYAKLYKAANDVNIHFAALEDGSAGTTITLPRIILCIIFAIAVIFVQVYFFKRRKKEG